MDRIDVEEFCRPLYIGREPTSQEVELHFGPDGDFFAATRIVEAIRSELDCMGFPVVAIPWSTEPYADRDSLRFSFDTEGLVVPDEVLNEVRLATKVRCWGVGTGHVEEYYFNELHLNTEVIILLSEGRAAPNHTELERDGVSVVRKDNRFSYLVNDKETNPRIDTFLVAEALGIFLQGGVSEPTRTELHEAVPTPDNELQAADSVTALEQLWNLSPPAETD